jgi:rubrerythrin
MYLDARRRDLDEHITGHREPLKEYAFKPKWQCRICGALFTAKTHHWCLNGTNKRNWIKLK